eukprot:scaffold6902_cov90-Isochrysis_galbana.AAC.1
MADAKAICKKVEGCLPQTTGLSPPPYSPPSPSQLYIGCSARSGARSGDLALGRGDLAVPPGARWT